MRELLQLFFIAAMTMTSTSTYASTACVLYMQNVGSYTVVLESCDGSELRDIFTSTSISAAMSKAIPYYVDRGFSLSSCGDVGLDTTNPARLASSYARCLFIKK